MSELALTPKYSDRLTNADTQFRSGNFLCAVQLYCEVLSEVEADQTITTADAASVILKVAECKYAAGDFESAKTAYEKLLDLQEQSNDISSKDRVFTLLKAAKNYEKCEDKINAQGRYEQVYELAKASLPVQHFLRRTVLECYAQWLRAEKSNPLILSILESELGNDQQLDIKRKDNTASPAKPFHPLEEQNRSSGERKPIKGEQEFDQLKAKLNSRKQKADNLSPDANPKSDDDKNSTSLKKFESAKSILRQVAARKFLNFSGSGSDKADRSKLKNVLVDDNGIQKNADFEAPKQLNAAKNLDRSKDSEFQIAKKEIQHEQANQDLLAEASELLSKLETANQKSPPPVQQDPLDTITDDEFVEKSTKSTQADLDHELQIERLLAESARLIYSLENPKSHEKPQAEEKEDDGADQSNGDEPEKARLKLKIRHDVAMRQSERSFFGQEEEKKEKIEQESFADKLEKLLPSTGKLTLAMKVGLPVVAASCLLAIFLVSRSNFKPDSLSHPPKFIAPLMDRDFVTADGAVSLAFKPSGLEIRDQELRRKPNIYFWQGSTNDELRLMQGTFKNCVWLRLTPEGLVSGDNQIFYASTSPERQLIEIIKAIKTASLGYFAVTGHYPNPDQIQPKQYINPITKKYDDVNTASLIVGKERPPESDKRLDLDLENGQMFNNEPGGKPGSVSVFCLQVGQPTQISGTPEQAYTESLYIHAFDSKGELLRTGPNHKVLLCELKPTGPKSSSETIDYDNFKNCDICLTNTEIPNAIGLSFKYFLFACLVIGLISFLFWSRKSTSESAAS